ncbi:hypothetical protein BJX99DRAFT_242696 [Aspergillus californicus]
MALKTFACPTHYDETGKLHSLYSASRIMAEPIRLASGLIALATVALESSISLLRTIRSFTSRAMQIRDLREELESLSEVLRTFTETAEIIRDEDLSALTIPLHRCGNACKEFEQEILKCFTQSGNSRTNFRGWAKLKYMDDDIDGFRRLLSAYKLTFIIALVGTNLRQTKVTAEVVESFKELIQTAQDDLETILKSIDDRLNALSGYTVTNSNEDVLELQHIREEQLSAQNSLQVCAQISDYIEQPGLTFLPTDTHLDSGYGSLPDTLIATNAGEEDDVRSVRSILTNKSRVKLAPDDEKLIISAFVGDLCQSFRLHGDPIRDRIAASLPDLLRTFSLRLEDSASSKADWDAKEFIRQQRARITNQFIQVQSPTQMSDEVDQRLPTDGGMSLTEKMAFWNLEEPADFLQEPAIADPSSDEVSINPRYQEVRDFLLGGSAYQWMLENVRAAASLTERKGTVVAAISKKLNDVISSIKITSARHSQRFQADFDMSWDLPAFLQDQEYRERIEVALEQAITLTASGVDVQAMSCADYMRQTWPSSGHAVVQAIKKTLISPNMWCSSLLPDGTTMDVGFRPGRTSIKARGSQAGLTELGEQLAWLAAALHPSPEPLGVCHATPEIIVFKPIYYFSSVPSIMIRIKPSFKRCPDQRTPTGETGTCWHGLFRNPVVVDGFPIRARPRDQRGLELSLEMMTVLAEAPYATPYDTTLILKGPCTMLVPTAQAAESVTWHFLYNADGRCMPCYAFRQRCPNWINTDQVNIDLLERRGVRHFVGWASTITRHLGTPDVEYNQISWAGSKRCTPGFAVEQRLTISVSKFVGGGASILRGERDKPEYVQHSAYTVQIDQARRTPIVLYDVAEKRGWLVDGASTLLHLARTQVERGPYGGLGSLFNNPRINREFFHHPDINSGPDGCAKVLKEECNMKHIIFREFDSYADESKTEERNEIHKTMCMRELVSQTWSTLQQIYDRQVDEATTHITKQLRSPVGKKLEGYEFMDIVSGNHILTCHHVGLGSNGATWTEFTNRIYPVTLFGSHFGDLYQPDKNIEGLLCPKWRTVPMGQEYLAAPVSLLWEIKYRSWCDGEVDADSPEIARRISWHPSQYAFRGCKPGCTHFWDRVQNL